jgi:molecular chaperone DnaJ
VASSNSKDYYDILGVPKDASAEDINKAFRTLARKLHPDVNKAPDAEERFKEVSEAYETLSDPQKRARYDAVRSGQFTTQNPYARPSSGSPGSGQPGTGDFGGFGGFDGWPFWGAPFTDFGQAYRQASGRSGRSGTAPFSSEAGAARHMDMTLTANESKHGATKRVTFERFERCEVCSGTGAKSRDSIATCGLCHGSGRVTTRVTTIMGDFEQETTCPECNGSGRVIGEVCPECSGSGTRLRRSTVEVEIPAGSHDGTTLRIKGAGDAGRNGGATGDLLVDLTVPSEHLTQAQSTGFTLLGVAIAFAVCILFYNTVLRLLTLFALPLFFVFFMFPMGGRQRGGSFLNRAARRVGLGIVIGLFLFILFMPLLSCSVRY